MDEETQVKEIEIEEPREVPLPSAEAPKRRRGRPPKAAQQVGEEGSPAPVPLPKRGRKRKPKVELTPDKLAIQIYGLHAMLDVVLPGAGISQDEAQVMGEAVHDLLVTYEIDISRYVPVIGFAIAVAMVEVPAAMRVWQNLRAKAEARKQQQSTLYERKVVPLDGSPGNRIQTQGGDSPVRGGSAAGAGVFSPVGGGVADGTAGTVPS